MDIVNSIHNKFIMGAINGTVYNYMKKIAINTQDSASDLESNLNDLIALDAKTSDDCDKYFQIRSAAETQFNKLFCNPSSKEIKALEKYAFNNRQNYNFVIPHNVVKLVLDFMRDNKEILKNSHPNNSGIEGTELFTKQYDIGKWIETMRYIYNTADTNNLSLDTVTNQITEKWNKDEASHFKNWMRYYQEGNYNKYNVKTAQFFQMRQDHDTPDINSVKDLFEPSASKSTQATEKQRRLDDARRKLRGRLKSVDELIEQYRDVLPKDVGAIIRKDVYDLREKVLGLELKASIVDSINRTSNQMRKNGFIEGAKALVKIAQEVANNTLPSLDAPVAIPAPNAGIVDEPVKEKKPKKQELPSFDFGLEQEPDTNGIPTPSPDKDQIRVPEVNIGEDVIAIPDFSSATHRDALQKLEEINKVISERNVVRALAAVDIILGQLGIASYFPQLSEAQSKMMDAFNYAGSRVAETIGQMRGGSGGPITITPPKPKEDAIEVSEETEKPIGEVVTGPPESSKKQVTKPTSFTPQAVKPVLPK